MYNSDEVAGSLHQSYDLEIQTPVSVDGTLFSRARKPDSLGALICPACGYRRYIGKAFVDRLREIRAPKEVLSAFPRHRLCATVMEMILFPEDMPPPLQPKDLTRIHFEAQDDDSAALMQVSAKTASNLQFHAFAQTFVGLEGEYGPWSQEERLDFCDMLWQMRAITLD